jgi:hypothetical protein
MNSFFSHVRRWYDWAIFIALTFWLMWYSLTTQQFTPDSWYYFDLSRLIDSDFYRVATIRNYMSQLPYSRSYPPLFPALIAGFNALFHQGILAGIYLNLLALTVIYFCLHKMARQLNQSAALAQASSLLILLTLFCTPAFIEEFQSARSILLTIALILFVVLIWNSERLRSQKLPSCLAFGLILGLATLNRFDFLIPSLVFMAIIFKKFGFRGLTTYALAFLSTISPYIIYSWRNFNSLWAMDFSDFGSFAFKHYWQDYYPNGFVFKTWHTDPVAWIQLKIYGFLEGFKSFLTLRSLVIPSLVTGVLVLISKPDPKRPRFTFLTNLFPYIYPILPILVAHIFSVVWAGYYQARYGLIELVIVAFIIVFNGLELVRKDPSYLQQKLTFALAATIFLTVSLVGHRFYFSEFSIHQNMVIRGSQLSPQEQNLANFIYQQPESKRRLLILSYQINPSRFAPLTGITTLLEPSNGLPPGVLKEFAKEWDVKFIYATDPDRQRRIAGELVLNNPQKYIYEVIEQ